jgi:predicted Rossmann fold flavoprotein
MLPNTNIFELFVTAKKNNGRKQISNILSEYLPSRIAKYIAGNDSRNIADIKDTELKQITEKIHNFYLPGNTLKYHNMSAAEVTYGGVSTEEISSKTMESKLCSGLYFVGEVLDITGDLGGFNLHWAWASGFVAGNNI